MEISSKRKFYELWRGGFLGNYIPMFSTLEEALASGLPKIGFREMGRGGGWWELAERKDVPAVFAKWKNAGKVFVMDGSVPNDKTTLQGEICRTERGLQGFLSVNFGPGGLPPMRQSIARGMHRQYGYVETRLLLDRFMDPSSREDLDVFLEQYPEAAIEFASFSVNVGVLPRRNTVFWEVRNY